MGKIILGGVDITGQRFGRLVALSFDSIKKHHHYWLFKCDCGVEKVINKGHVVKIGCKSCGCYNRELILKRSVTHGMAHTSEYHIWSGIIARTTNKNHKYAYRYVDRGITVCDSWKHSFEQFYKDMGAKPSSKHTIDRINNDGNYEPGNCRWATMSEQNNNTSVNVQIIVNGISMTARQWSNITGINPETIRGRLVDGWSPERAVNTPPRITNPRNKIKSEKNEPAIPRN